MKLIDVADISVGYPFKSKDFNEEGKGIRLVRGKNVTKRALRWESDTRWWEQIDSSLDSYLLKAGDIVLGMDGSLVGKNFARIREEDLPLYLVQRVACIRAKEPEIQEFLWQSIASERFSAYIDSIKTGTSIPHISGKQIGEYDLPDLSVDTMEKIGSILESIEGKVNINNKINRNLSEQAQALFEQEVCNAETEKNIEELADVKGGKRLPKGINLQTIPNKHPYIRIRDLNDSWIIQLNSAFEYVDDETQKSIERYIVDEKDVLISIVGTIGLSAMVHSSLDKANLTENCVKLTNLKEVSPEYLLLYIKSQAGQNAIAQGTVGAVQPKLPIKNIQAIKVPIIEGEKMQKLNAVIQTFFDKIADNLAENIRLAELRDSLLPKLMSRELDVSDLDI